MQSPRSPDGLSLIVFEESLDANLLQVSQLAVRNITGADFAGITLMRHGKPTTAAFTDPASPKIDSAQYETGVGPCLDAFRTNRIYRIEDTRTETAWPEFAKSAADHGVLSTLSLPLVAGSAALGAMNLYSKTRDSFDDDDDGEGMVFAVQ